MTHPLPNGGKGVRFWYFARGSSAHCALRRLLHGVSTCGRFSRIPSHASRHRNPVRKKRHAIGSVCRPSLQGARRREGSHASLHLPRSVRWKPWGRFAGRSPRWRASDRARSPATSTKPTACPRRRSSERCVKQRADAPGVEPLSGARRRRRRLRIVSASSSRRAAPTSRRGDRGDEGWEAHRANPKSARFFAPSPIIHPSLRADSPRLLFARARAPTSVDPRFVVRHSCFVSIRVYSSKRRW